MGSIGDFVIQVCNASFFGWEWLRRCLGRPPVERISTSDLKAMLAVDARNLILIDVRSRAEQQVSIIPGAIPQHQVAADPSCLIDKNVVVYCTIGGRSYLVARRLVVAGVHAKNYRDGILGWRRAELPLETMNGAATTAVHTYWRIFHVPGEKGAEN